MNGIADKIVNAVLFPFGHCRVKLGEWPDDSDSLAVTAIQEAGGVPDGEDGLIGFDNLYFRVQGHRLKLSVQEYGPTFLWGQKRLVRQLACQIAD